ncbi:hypothetical protein [Mycolicibacterium aromaticivorans]|uniref:hypothetical protein n=1 Tax=Mycolicibacterium aromaticivorans TaxID=318425 RepID=UPI0004B607C0|nr:hypothetical protein [Mycolicibacterium aromaticivorans]
MGYAALTILLLVSIMLWCYGSVGDVSVPRFNRVPAISTSALAIAAGTSALALSVRRFRWCCAAAYTCGLSTAIGTGALWWVRTGRPEAPMAWLIIADVAVGLLTACWLSVIVKPIELSQPQMRAYLGVDS